MSATTRLLVLNRMQSLYGMIEQSHSASLLRSKSALREVEVAIAEQIAQIRAARLDSLEALLATDREQWALCEAQNKVAFERMRRFEIMRRDRVIQKDEAQIEYNASRINHEQMKSLFEGVKTNEATHEGRRDQFRSDDRFLSRLHWTGLQTDKT